MATFEVCGLPQAAVNGLFSCAFVSALWLCSSFALASDVDPWEGFNRGVHKFNDRADGAILKPVAQTYDRLLPGFFKRAVHNVFRNVGTPAVLINQLLQGKPRQGASDGARFVLNSTLGIGGIFDVATAAGIAEHDEDFGQTLRVWGLSNGPYLVVPLRGPASVTHAAGMVVDSFMNPVRFVSPDRHRYAIQGLSFVDSRAQLLSTEVLVSGDRYLFFREAYLQRREYLVNDGLADEDPFLDEFEDPGQ